MLFYNLLGFYPDDIRYYQLALHHKSVPIHTQDGRNLCNERLEFLGDAILNSAKEIGLDKAIIASRYVNLHANSNIYGNALEALFGAIYLDQGYRKCKTFVEERLFSHILDWNDILQKEINYKSRVLEWCHKRHIEPEFDLLNETVQRNKHTFHTCLKIQGHIISQATGGSKKESQQKAAEIAYKKMCADPHFLEKIIEQPQPTEE